MHACIRVQKAQLLEEGRRQSQAAGPLAALDCSVCLTRPIQVHAVAHSHADDICFSSLLPFSKKGVLRTASDPLAMSSAGRGHTVRSCLHVP